MSFTAGDPLVAANHVHRFTKRLGTNTTVSGGWTGIPFATLSEGAMTGVTTADNITYTLGVGLWTVMASLVANTNTGLVAALFEGTNADPLNAANSEIYSLESGSNTGSVGAVTVNAEIYVPSGTRQVRCSAFGTGTTLRNTAPGRPRLTFSWRY